MIMDPTNEEILEFLRKRLKLTKTLESLREENKKLKRRLARKDAILRRVKTELYSDDDNVESCDLLFDETFEDLTADNQPII